MKDWLFRFNQSTVTNIAQTSSNHLPVLLELNKFLPLTRRKQFCFENAWFCDPKCYRIIQSSWVRSEGLGIRDRLQQCGAEVEKWGRAHLLALRDKAKEFKRIIQ